MQQWQGYVLKKAAAAVAAGIAALQESVAVAYAERQKRQCCLRGRCSLWASSCHWKRCHVSCWIAASQSSWPSSLGHSSCRWHLGCLQDSRGSAGPSGTAGHSTELVAVASSGLVCAHSPRPLLAANCPKCRALPRW